MRKAAVLLGLAAAVAAHAAARSGEEVVQAVCAACHATGVNGAPRIGDESAWRARAAQGLTSLTRHAIQGIRRMPPHGGNPGVSDFEIELAITYMVSQSGGHWATLMDKSTPMAERTGEQIVQAQCVKCHAAGVEGAPRIGDRAAWIPRLRQGLDALLRSAIRGHGGIPTGKGYYHVNVSLFDSATNAPITDATVTAAVSDPMMSGETKTLELMATANAPSYGNCFRISGMNPHTITVHVGRPGAGRAITARFDFAP